MSLFIEEIDGKTFESSEDAQFDRECNYYAANPDLDPCRPVWSHYGGWVN